MLNKIIKLRHENREIKLLQIFFGVICIISFIVAGVVALFNQALGVAALIVPLVFFVALIVNTVAWSLIKSFIEYLEDKTKKDSASEKIAKKSK